MVECDRADGGGCGAIWVEMDNEAVDRCPGCDREIDWTQGPAIINSENCPDVSGLRENGIPIVWDETRRKI